MVIPKAYGAVVGGGENIFGIWGELDVLAEVARLVKGMKKYNRTVAPYDILTFGKCFETLARGGIPYATGRNERTIVSDERDTYIKPSKAHETINVASRLK
jgi:hypothetical protein